MNKLSASFLIALSIFFVQARAQDEDSTKEKAASYFKFGLEYLSDNVYLGRKDSVRIPYLTPSIGYYARSGLYAKASASYLTSEGRMDAFTLEGGYTFSHKKLEGEASISKVFYSNQSYSVKSELGLETSVYASYDLGFIKPTLNGSISFGSSTDYAAGLGFDHSFSVLNDHGEIDPSFLINGSTQNYYNSYYHKRKYAKGGKKKKVVYDVTASALNVSQFKILDYEFALPLNYTLNKFTFSATPTVAVPVHPNIIVLTVKPTNGPAVTKTYQENIGTSFYWSLGITYKL